MADRNWRWVSRDTDNIRNVVDVWLGEEKPEAYVEYPEKETVCIIWDGPRHAAICHAAFLETTGIDIQPGTCVRVEFTAKVLEE